MLNGVAHFFDGAAQFSVSGSGGLLYLPGADDETARTLAWVDRHGVIEPVAASRKPRRTPGSPRTVA